MIFLIIPYTFFATGSYPENTPAGVFQFMKAYDNNINHNQHPFLLSLIYNGLYDFARKNIFRPAAAGSIVLLIINHKSCFPPVILDIQLRSMN